MLFQLLTKGLQQSPATVFEVDEPGIIVLRSKATRYLFRPRYRHVARLRVFRDDLVTRAGRHYLRDASKHQCESNEQDGMRGHNLLLTRSNPVLALPSEPSNLLEPKVQIRCFRRNACCRIHANTTGKFRMQDDTVPGDLQTAQLTCLSLTARKESCRAVDSGFVLSGLQGGQPGINVTQIPPGYPLIATWTINPNISSLIHLTWCDRNLSKPSPIPHFLSLKCLDLYENSGSWAPSPNARSKQRQQTVTKVTGFLRTLVPQLVVTLVCSFQNQKLYRSSTSAARCRSSR